MPDSPEKETLMNDETVQAIGALEPKALNVEKVAEAAVAAHPGDLDSQRDFVAKVAQNTESDEYVK